MQSVTEQLQQVFIVNPQWSTGGNIVSDFGFGPWRKAAEDFLATFEQARAPARDMMRPDPRRHQKDWGVLRHGVTQWGSVLQGHRGARQRIHAA